MQKNNSAVRNRRFAQISTSDDEEEEATTARPSHASNGGADDDRSNPRPKRRKTMKIPEEEEEDGEKEEPEEPEEAKESSEEVVSEDAKPVGDVVRVSGKGRGRRSHFAAFEFDGNSFELEDPVLLVPEDTDQKPYVAIIKDITQSRDGSLMVTGQWFYRPDEAEKKGGGGWQSSDTRELFYSFHRDEVPAESVMHRCVVHFIPLNKQLPKRKQHPGFIVRKVYDTVERKLWKLTDKDYEDSKQHEIDLLVQKTVARIGELPDIETEDAVAQEEDMLKHKKSSKRKNMLPLDVPRPDEASTRSDLHLKAETPGSCTSKASEYYTILENFKALTGETQRDKWLERLLQAVQFVCDSADTTQANGEEKGGPGCIVNVNGSTESANASQQENVKGGGSLLWPDATVPAITALERASHDTLSLDFQKYNQKMRQLVFNLKNTALLARRLLNGELEPLKILNMTPNELKEGMTVEETATKEPEESKRMQMTDARCKRCTEKKVGLIDIIQAGLHARYQLECVACGNIWYASTDEASTLSIDEPSTGRNVGTAPWATAKFEAVEKKLINPRESDKSSNDVFKKTTDAYIPVLESQRSFNKVKAEENAASEKKEV